MKFLLCLLWAVPSFAFVPLQRPRRGSSNNYETTRNRYSDSSRAYANFVDPPLSQNKPSFESRMRNLVLNPTIKKKKSLSTTAAPGHPAVHRVTSLQEYKRLVVDQEKLTVVRFYADYCRSCRAMTPLFYRLAQQNNPTVQFVEVPVTAETAAIHKGLDVPSVPFGHVYHPQVGLVEELRLRKEFFKDFAQILQSYQQGECTLPEDPKPDMQLYDSPYERHM